MGVPASAAELLLGLLLRDSIVWVISKVLYTHRSLLFLDELRVVLEVKFRKC